MALRAKVLQKKAEKFELKESQKINITPERLSELGKLLDDAYTIRRPKSEEYKHRKMLVQIFNEIAKEIYGKSGDCPVVEEFGSFSMDLFSTGSDLDMSVNFRQHGAEVPRDLKIRTLRKFAKKFFALQSVGHVHGVQTIVSAKVPILKVTDSGTGVECDLSVENRDGIVKSKIVHLISSIDERFHKLSFLMKTWAKAHKINSSKDRTLNSLSIILLVAFHLQTRNPPILPPFSAILKDGTDVATVERSVRNFKNYGRSNTESLAELFMSFLLKLSSIEKLWAKGLCASTYEGSWISKEWDSKVATMSVEDFTDRSQNVARAVGKSQVEDIYKCIQRSIQLVSTFMYGYSEGSRLRDSLFGTVDVVVAHPSVALTLVKAPPLLPVPGGQRGEQHIATSNPVSSTAKRTQPMQGWGGVPTHRLDPTSQIMPFENNLSKKIRVNEGWGGTAVVSSGGSTSQGWGGAGSWRAPATQGWGGVMRDRWEAGETQGLGAPSIWRYGAQGVNWTSEASQLRSQEMQPVQNGWGRGGVQENWRAVKREAPLARPQGVNWTSEASQLRSQEMQPVQNGWGRGGVQENWRAVKREAPLARPQEVPPPPVDGWTPWGRTNHAPWV